MSKQTKHANKNKGTTLTPTDKMAVVPDSQPPPTQTMERKIISTKEVAGLYFGFCGPFPGCRYLKARDDRGEDSLDGCFCCLLLPLPIQKEFHRGPVTNGSPNVFHEWTSERVKLRDEMRNTKRDTGRRLHIDNKCCNHETLCGTGCPCCCAVKIFPLLRQRT